MSEMDRPLDNATCMIALRSGIVGVCSSSIFLLARGSLKLAWGLLLLQLFSENLNHGGFLVLPGSCTDWGFVGSLGPCPSPTRRRF